MRTAPIVAFFTALALAGCANGVTTPVNPKSLVDNANVVPGSFDLSRAAAAPRLPSWNVLYVSDILDSVVDLYQADAPNPSPIGELRTDISVPAGMAIDGAHRLYVANNAAKPITAHVKGLPSEVPVFPAGSGSPSRVYFHGIDHPTDVAVGSDGTLYVDDFGDGAVAEYPKGSKTPTLQFKAPAGVAFALALDGSNDLYVSCVNSNAIYEFPPGSTQGTNLGLVLGGEPHGMAFDAAGDLVVAVSMAPNSGSVIDVFPPGKTRPSKQFTGTFQPFMIAFDRAKQHLYVADFGSGNHDGGVFEFAYPSGTLVTEYTHGGASGAYGVAVNPPAP